MFLIDTTIDATNWRAEQALRPAVITRKVNGGGNRTRNGAETQQVLATVIRTGTQRGLDQSELFVKMLRSRKPMVPKGLRTQPE
jgi:transposase